MRFALTQAQVDAALLAPADVAAGWKVDTSDFQLFSDDSSTDSTKSTVTPASCQSVMDKLNSDDGTVPTAKNHTQVTSAKGSSVLGEDVEVIPGTKASDLTEISAAFAQCPSYTETDADGTVTNYTVAPLSIPPLGDGSAGFKVTVKNSGVTIPMSVAFVADGDVQISVMGIGVDANLLAQATTKAFQKVAAAGTAPKA